MAVTGCFGSEDVELTILSKYAPESGMFKWNLDGTVENLKNPFKVVSVKTECILMRYLNNVSIFFGRKSRWLEEVIKKKLTSWLTQTLLLLKLQLHNHVLLETAKLYQQLTIFKSEYVFHMYFFFHKVYSFCWTRWQLKTN